MIMATTASAVSSEPTVRAEDAGLDAGGGIGAFAGAGATGRATEVPGALAGAVPDGGDGGRGTWAVDAAAGAEAGRAAVGAAPPGAAAADAPVGGNEGSLIVGAAVGFGGSAIRTVSFFGCTLAASGGIGESGVGSAINLSVRETRVGEKQSQTVNPRGEQIPNPKNQSPNKFQNPNFNLNCPAAGGALFGIWTLGICWGLGFEIWNLTPAHRFRATRNELNIT